ncbi:phenylacetate--CoA ligase family protein [Taibaiella chishuiensis]|uniref:Phenylacetate-CoA ligase n=1 Tax=Taibaiella chishuiensis TaxID=1434707 RepID=A0A2P8D0B3_9BACT|nr:AMP-binding protein [Taibaiella chishuiensis]PSK90647.1 phenylacetate-CoA ligase [Taibaiella chishuiensis]
MAILPEIEKQSLSEQQRFQLEQLHLTLEYLQQHSPFYQRLFASHAVQPDSIRSLDDLVRLPTTSKEDLQRYNMDFLCVPAAAVQEYVATSGTLGSPVTIALTEKDLQRLAYNEYLSFGCLECSEDDIFQLMLTLDRQFMAGVAYYSGLRQAGPAIVRTGPGLTALQWDTIQRLGVTGLVGVPSFLLKMIAYAGEQQIDCNATTVRKVLAIGESLRDDQLEPNTLARKIQDAWQIQLYSTYASTEMQTAFTECPAGKGGHHHPELIIVELLDDEGQPVPAGEKGEVTITTLGVEAMPLLRYRTGDICRGYYEPCSCGRSTMRLGPVLGRKQQMIKFKGTSLYPPALFDLLNQVPVIDEYVVEVTTDETQQDDLHIYIATSMQHDACNRLLEQLFRHKLRVMPRTSYITDAEMLRLQFPEGSRKLVRFRDLRS